MTTREPDAPDRTAEPTSWTPDEKTLHCRPIHPQTAIPRSMTTFLAIDHVQLAMPPGSEDEARRFYEQTLGPAEVPKPATLAGRGGAWFQAGGVQLHLGREEPFRPATRG
jgi:hypothetical protein